jgi:protein TonB
MLETLLESKSKRSRSTTGAIISVTTHTALIAAALYATAQAKPERAKPSEMIHPIYIPRVTSPIAATSPTTTPRTPTDGRRLMFVEPNLAITVPAIDVTGVVSKPGDFGPSAIGSVVPGVGVETGTGVPGGPLRADQVEKQVMVVAGAAPPRYPEVLRSAGIEGQVTALFVVDEQGRAEEASLRFSRSDNELFEDAVRVALRRMRFIAAEVGGRKVRQLVQMPFVFTLAR